VIRAGNAEVNNPAEPHIVHEAQHLGWHFYHKRPVVQVNPDLSTGRVVVGGQIDRTRIHLFLVDRHCPVHRTKLADGVAVRGLAHRRQGQKAGLHGALKIEIIIILTSIRHIGPKTSVKLRSEASCPESKAAMTTMVVDQSKNLKGCARWGWPRARYRLTEVFGPNVPNNSTYWYLTATPELLSQAAGSFATYAMAGGEP